MLCLTRARPRAPGQLSVVLAASLSLGACGDVAGLASATRDAGLLMGRDSAGPDHEAASDAGVASIPSAANTPDATAHLDAGLHAAAMDTGLDAAAAIASGLDALVAPPTNDAALDASASSEAGSAARADAERHGVGTTRVVIPARTGRTLNLQLWYPAVEAARAEASAGHPVSQLEPEGPRRALLERLLANAPEGCASRYMHAALGATPLALGTPYPLIVYSHHSEGMRIATFSLAERLAQLGFVVAAPDHTGHTLYDRTDDLKTADLVAYALRTDPGELAVRADDIQSVIDVLLDASASAIPEGLRGKIDPARVGMFGHSMGSMTAGIVTARDKRVRAAAFLSFPPATTSALFNLLEQPELASFHVPALFMLNQEDASLNSVGGNDAIRAQFEAYPEAAHLVEVRDTGHWSFADDCGLIPDFADGCGKGTRSSAEPFGAYQNLDNQQVRALAAEHLATFFAQQLLGLALPGLVAESTPRQIVRAHAARSAPPSP